MLAQLSCAIQQQVEADDFEDASAIAPVAYVNILDIGEFADEFGAQPGLFLDFAQRGLVGLLAFVDSALWAER